MSCSVPSVVSVVEYVSSENEKGSGASEARGFAVYTQCSWPSVCGRRWAVSGCHPTDHGFAGRLALPWGSNDGPRVRGVIRAAAVVLAGSTDLGWWVERVVPAP